MQIKKRRGIKAEDFPVGTIFFIPFMDDSEKGVFGYVKYAAFSRKNPYSLCLSLADIYDHVCKFDEWTDDIKKAKIKISDMIFNAGYFKKTQHNTKPFILTNEVTDIIHLVIRGYFKTDSSKYWYDADDKNVIFPADESVYRWIEMVFPPYDQKYVQAIFDGKTLKYGDKYN